MPLRPDILLNPQVVDAGQAVRSGFLTGQGIAQAPMQNRLLQAQVQQAEQQAQLGQMKMQQAGREMAEFERNRVGTALSNAFQNIEPFMESGDTVGAMQALGREYEKVLDNPVAKNAVLEAMQAIGSGDQEGIERVKTTGRNIVRQFPTQATQQTTSGRDFSRLMDIVRPALDDKGNLDPKKLNAEQEAAAIQLDLIPPKRITARERAALTPGLSEKIAESESKIKQRVKFGEMTGASRAKAIDSGFAKIEGIDKNIRNIDSAIAAIDEGASTGAIESRFFPSFRESTIKLEQIQKELGLDVIGATTFGALSEGELDLALQTALPTGLKPEALRAFLVDKKAAQQKLREYFEEQIDFLDQGGSIAGFIRSKKRQRGLAQTLGDRPTRQTETPALQTLPGRPEGASSPSRQDRLQELRNKARL